MQQSEGAGRTSMFSNRRGMSVAMAAIVMAVIVIIGGVGTFAALNSVGASKTTKTSCAPASACNTVSTTNDVTLFIPYTVGAGQTYAVVAAGASPTGAAGVGTGSVGDGGDVCAEARTLSAARTHNAKAH